MLTEERLFIVFFIARWMEINITYARLSNQHFAWMMCVSREYYWSCWTDAYIYWWLMTLVVVKSSSNRCNWIWFRVRSRDWANDVTRFERRRESWHPWLGSESLERVTPLVTPNRPSRVQVHGFQRVSSNSRSARACGTNFRKAIEKIEALRRKNNNDSMFLYPEKQLTNQPNVFFIAYCYALT